MGKEKRRRSDPGSEYGFGTTVRVQTCDSNGAVVHLLRQLSEQTKTVLKNGAEGVVRLREHLRGRRSRPLLVLAHMRSGSTLLLHLLVDHPAVDGYGERNHAFRSLSDFDRLRVDVCYRSGRWWRSPRYVADQINHDRYTPGPELVRASGARCVILIREPEAAIGSMVHVLGRHYPDLTVERAVAHYEDRLASLRGLAGSLSRQREPSSVFFLTYEDLIQRADASLAGLTRFLELDIPVDETYEVGPETGRRGDPSSTIRTGRIVREKSSHRAPLDPNIRSRLVQRYRSCCRELRGTIPSLPHR